MLLQLALGVAFGLAFAIILSGYSGGDFSTTTPRAKEALPRNSYCDSSQSSRNKSFRPPPDAEASSLRSLLPAERIGDVRPRCVTRFIRYTSSKFEDEWAKTVTPEDVQQKRLCSIFKSSKFSKYTNIYTDDCVKKRFARHEEPIASNSFSRLPASNLDPEVYSAFEYERVCVEGAIGYEDDVNGIVTADWEEKYTPTADEMAIIARGLAYGVPSAAGSVACGGRADNAAFANISPRARESVHFRDATANSDQTKAVRVRRTQYKSYIEPLVGLLRDPRVCRDPDAYLLVKDWLAVDPLSTFTKSTAPQKRFIFDLGASSWRTGAGGASQSWFYHTYRSYGADINEIYAWELTQVKGEKFFDDIPDHLKPIYHYFNYALTPAWGDWDNPLNHILQRTHVDDLVILKIDFDSGPIESALVDEIMANEELSDRIDELYFEHHVRFEILEKPWKRSIDPRHTYADSIRMFTNLRKRGIRAHSWV